MVNIDCHVIFFTFHREPKIDMESGDQAGYQESGISQETGRGREKSEGKLGLKEPKIKFSK
jgi:hypothetical protein